MFNCNNYAANNRFEVGELNQEQQSLIDTFYSTEPVPMLKHPLYIETLFVPCLGSARYALEVIKAREQVANKQLSCGQYLAFVFTHERPFRFDAFLRICHKITDTQSYWQVLDQVWHDCENPCAYNNNRIVWSELWQGEYVDHAPLTVPCDPDNQADIDIYNSLLETFTVYRGGHVAGFSWSLSKDKAAWFATRSSEFGNNRFEIHSLEVKKSEVCWFTNARNELEVIVLKNKSTAKTLESF
ncbi:hypothetical protein [Photobacterium leiognathi]|uniref:hypothetical protein n=1 Tax=Photobacterium leiognathi TaxID=553611 RepID=UPI0027387905|nr:hypothetical protein [Photobacterium leiognathi]